MRLPRLDFELPNAPWPALVAIAATVPPALLHAALASAAGTLFEAAPFVLAAEVLPRRRAAVLAGAGCGCGRSGFPGAVSLPATALCWLAFGPWVAAARFAAGAALAFRRRRAGAAVPARPVAASDPFADLLGLIVPTILASLAAQAAGTHLPGLRAAWLPLVVVGGACLGALVPCATAGVAIAAGLAHPLPAAAAGLLATAGLVTGRPALPPNAALVFRNAGFASVLLALALIGIVWRGPAGLVNPRLLPFDAAAAALAVAGIRRRRTSARAAPLVGAGLACALVTGYAVPQSIASETTLVAAFPGERVEFTGVAHASGRSTTLQRFAIACCRLDASPVAIRLTRPLPFADGTWVAVRGRFVREGPAQLVRPERWESVPAPADPFVYR